MNRSVVLNIGVETRRTVLELYRRFPQDDAARLARRMVFEVGKVVEDMHNQGDAAAMLYSAADAIAARMPIEDFRINLTAGEKAQPPARSIFRRLFSAITDRFFIGVCIGLIAGGRP